MDTTGQLTQMADEPTGRPPDQVRSGYLVGLRIVAVLSMLTILVQPVTAGLFVTGQVSYLSMHAAGAAFVMLLVVLQLVAAVLLWRPGHGSWTPMLFSVVEFVLVITQMVVGGSRALAVHLPLGVALFGAALLFAVWTFSRGARVRHGRGAR